VVIALYFSTSNFSLDEGYKIWELWSFFIMWLVLTAFTPLDYLIHEFDHGSTLIVYYFDPRLQEAILRFSLVGILFLLCLCFLIVSSFNLAWGHLKTRLPAFNKSFRHRVESWKYGTQRNMFDKIRGVFRIAYETLSPAFDTSPQSNQKPRSKRRYKIKIKVYAN